MSAVHRPSPEACKRRLWQPVVIVLGGLHKGPPDGRVFIATAMPQALSASKETPCA